MLKTSCPLERNPQSSTLSFHSRDIPPQVLLITGRVGISGWIRFGCIVAYGWMSSREFRFFDVSVGQACLGMRLCLSELTARRVVPPPRDSLRECRHELQE